MIKDLLQGKPINHPLHPALVHLPIGLFILSLFFDVAAVLTEPNNQLVRGAFYTMIFGVVTALLAAVPGLVDWADIRADHPAKKTATYHMLLNLAAVGLYAVNIGVRSGSLDAPATPVVPLLLSLAAVGMIMFSGYLGGELIYLDGIAVGRHRRHSDPPRQTLQIDAADADDGFVPVASAAGLGDHETLRVEVDGQVMAIVNLDGQFYAFQEFCTHRYGPLSEGHFQDGQVECPWHRSCFDVRTGKVTQGPAKVDLKTYEVTIRDDRIYVRVRQEERLEEREVGGPAGRTGGEQAIS